MTASVRILSTSSVDSTPSVVFVAPDGSKILINCGEGCQRIFLEHSQRLSTVKAVCLTHLGHESIGGLPGMILTSSDVAITALSSRIVADSKNNQLSKLTNQLSATDSTANPLPSLELIGPTGTKHFIHSLRHFMRRDKFTINVHEGSVNNFRLSSTIKKLKKQPEDFSTFFTIQSVAFQQAADSSPVLDSTRKRTRNDSMQLDRKNLERQFLSFIVSTPPTPGRFLVEKAIELGIPKGNLYAQLKSGKTVTFTNKDGNEQTVESHQVVTPSSPSSAVLILYYPISQVADGIFSSDFSTYVECAEIELVIHIAPDRLFEKYGVAQWKDKDDNTPAQHIFLSTDRASGDIDGTPFQSAAAGAQSRSFLNKDIYLTPSLSSSINGALTGSKRYRLGRRMMEYNLMPRSKRGFLPMNESENFDYADLMKYVEESGALRTSNDVHASINQSLLTHDEGELIFTGTGSAVPCKHRNVTGMFMKQADGRSILLDVGEGTVGQLLRSQSADCKIDMLNSIKAAWISHPHADHHLGLLRLLGDRPGPDPIMLIAPAPIFRFLEEYSFFNPSICNSYDAVDCQSLVNNDPELMRRIQYKLGIGNCRAVPVQHCPHSFACILEETDFGRLVYSGDCRPSNSLVVAAKGADLLIHEATFEDGMEADAALKRHSTIGEALDVADRMGAKCTILTHFSQRYPKIQPIPLGRADSFPIIFAFDYMRVKPSTLVIASKLTPALRLLYPEVECVESSKATGAEIALSIPGIFARNELL